MDRRARIIAIYALFLSYLALAGFVRSASATSDDRSNEGINHDGHTQQRLGVIVPTYRGDLDRAVSSLGRWPKICSTVTQENVDLVLYHVEEEDTTAAAAIPAVANSAGRCFARTRLVYANLVDQENLRPKLYPTGPSEQFYEVVPDEDNQGQLSEYDALAIMQWNAVVATYHFFEDLYKAALDPTGGKEVECADACGGNGVGFPAGVSTVCDATCSEGGRFGGYLCGAGDTVEFGPMCRLCFNDIKEARKAESRLMDGKHVIMCDTMCPPAAADCSDECALGTNTVCDEACGTGLHGDYGCNWKKLGAKCRSCFEDGEAVLKADEIAKRHGGRAIMCDTHEPPEVAMKGAPVASTTRRLRPWKEDQKWKTTEKWKTDGKYKTVQKLRGDGNSEPK